MEKPTKDTPLDKFGASLYDTEGLLYEMCEDCDDAVYCELCNDFHCRLWLQGEKWCKYHDQADYVPEDPLKCITCYWNDYDRADAVWCNCKGCPKNPKT